MKTRGILLQCGLLSAMGCAMMAMSIPTADAASVLYVANGKNGTISKISSTGSVSTLVSGLQQPYGLAASANGNFLYVVNSDHPSSGGGYNIDSINVGGGGVNTITNLSAAQPAALTVDNVGNLYVSLMNGVIDKITTGGVVTQFADMGSTSEPDGLAFGPDGNLYVSNYGTGTIDQVVGNTVNLVVNDSGGPGGLAFDSSGNLYVANGNTNNVEQITPGGGVSTFATITGEPNFLTFGNGGNLYVTLYTGGVVDKISSSGVVSTFATGLDGPAGIVALPAPVPASFGLVGIGSLAMIGGLTLRRRMANIH